MIVGLNHTLKFGKYTGKKLATVINKDPEYVLWATRTIPTFELSESALKFLEIAEYRLAIKDSKNG